MLSRAFQEAKRLLKPTPAITFPDSAASRPRPIHLEVERKFVPTAYLESQLGSIRSPTHRLPLGEDLYDAPKVLTSLRLPNKLVRDTYFDLNGCLSERGIWIRRREELTISSLNASPHRCQKREEWQAKIRLGGDFVDSQFEEAEGEEAVTAILSQHLPHASLAKLNAIADLRTDRRTWSVRDAESSVTPQAVEVMLDRVTEAGDKTPHAEDFCHDIGEVELSADMEGGTEHENDRERKQQIIDRMHCTLSDFMLRHNSLFPVEPTPIGKLSAYFMWKESARKSDKGPG
ncbi:hypothetical protein LTR08_002776 [Meristemomyces frigidus]|nr:hypothetical protein LTR08_002776 [Meristemomyces frigidus]